MQPPAPAKPATTHRRHWLFGYGSLISSRSRQRTVKTTQGAAFAAIASGIGRGWYLSLALPKGTRQPTAIKGIQTLGVSVSDAAARCNGVVFAVTDEEWRQFAEREQGYRPLPIDWRQIEAIDAAAATLMQHAIKAGELLFCYLPQRPLSRPSAQYPILQSYVDVILAGCAAISEPFISQFLRTTEAWPDTLSACVDDRLQPVYPRHCANAYADRARWDNWLARLQPQTLHCRRQL